MKIQLVFAFVAVGASSFAQLVFQDNFNAENGGAGALNYPSFANWTVSSGTVDLIGNGFFDYYPGNGLYIDLDGSSGDAGVLSSTSLSLTPQVYTVSFQLGGRPDGNTNSVNVSFGSWYSELFTLPSTQGLTTFTRNVNVGAVSSASLSFAETGNDNFGLLLDNVRITAVPEPGSMLALTAGAALLLRRKK